MVRVTSREVEADAMHRVTRESVSLQGADVTAEQERAFIHEMFADTESPDARTELQHLIDSVADWLAAKGWPDPRRYRVLFDKDGWRYMPKPLPPPPIQAMLAVPYIVKEAGALSMAGLMARVFEEATAALGAYEAGDLDALYNRTHNLATLRERATARSAFLRDVERGRKAHKGAREGGRAKAAKDEADTERRLELMGELVPKHGISGAARFVAARGLGTPSANRGLWYRHRK